MVLLIVFIVGAALFVGLRGGSAGNTCKANHPSVAYKVAIHDGKVSDDHVYAKRCDTLTITNEDSGAREIAFGLHEHHEPYNGVAERLLGHGQSLTVTLNQTGAFRWHDHIHDEVQGYFTVAD